MKRTILYLGMVLFLSGGALFAQQPGYNYTFIDLMDYVNRHSKIMTFHEPYSEIAGDPYLNNEFIDGEIFTTDKVVMKGRLRYNIYADEMEFIVKDNVYWIDNQEKIETIKYGDHLFIFYPNEDQKFDKGNYYEVLENGPTKLLLKRRVVLMDAVPAKPYQDPKPPRFEKSKDTYLLMRFQGTPEKVSNKKDLMRIMADKEEDVKSFIKKNKISANNSDDLKKLVAFYNAL